MGITGIGSKHCAQCPCAKQFFESRLQVASFPLAEQPEDRVPDGKPRTLLSSLKVPRTDLSLVCDESRSW